ncbi:FecR domain-containing protein [Herbaspirillum sp. LeCh32-8]|uniref:FecR domain-containing protein n=1 Tax=Herbaspirillum sp. LeCh32-8 TaxID=2821356 RepID=UPI001AEAF8CE|nr:FecR domain-containing protein [Herbaspirillum sp. LeCh32-8]MBP0599279.1 FecR domain-containing protein [Herbaspirillum sp. LeCh32-8]
MAAHDTPARPAGARNDSPEPDQRILGEAVDWLMRLQSNEADPDALRRWREADPRHAAAWARVESLRGMMGTVRELPPGAASGALQQANRNGRRRALGLLAAMAALPAAWLAWREKPWEELSADLRTAVGERRSQTLPDGTRLVLNSHSAVNILFNQHERRIRLLAGEILVTTAPDPAPVHRSLLVQTPQGEAYALGTRFSVRRFEDDTAVAVFEGAVEIRNNNPAQRLVLQAGEQTRFGALGVADARPADPASAMWELGMLVAKDMPLAELLAELSRYRRGVLRCDAAIAGMQVTGAFPLDDIDRSLSVLTASLKLSQRRVSRWWISIEPA